MLRRDARRRRLPAAFSELLSPMQTAQAPFPDSIARASIASGKRIARCPCFRDRIASSPVPPEFGTAGHSKNLPSAAIDAISRIALTLKSDLARPKSRKSIQGWHVPEARRRAWLLNTGSTDCLDRCGAAARSLARTSAPTNRVASLTLPPASPCRTATKATTNSAAKYAHLTLN